MQTTTEILLNRFLDECQEMINEAYKANSVIPKLSVEPGSRFLKIVKGDGSCRSAYGFIEIATGDVYKAASWKVPAKHVRGNVKNHANTCAGPYGIVYLR